MEKQLNKTKFVDEFSKEIFDQTYTFFKGETINAAQYRTAADLAEVENDYPNSKGKEYWTDQFNSVLEDFKLVTGGRILSNAGTGLKGTTYINCFVDGFTGTDQDSMASIMDALKRQAMILKSEGGYGFCADTMRPRGAYINGIGNDSPGSVKMLEMWDKQSEVITAGSGKKSTREKGKTKIRKGAQMVTMSIWHPDIEEFITSKQTPGRLTKFNMSVLITDDFMNAVASNSPWKLEFPVIDDNVNRYENEWDGNLKKWKEKGFETVTYKTFENANELWDLIMTSTYNRNEPGVLFVDVMNKLNNLYYCEHITATNPCGEQILPVGGVCLLGSLNVTQYVDFKNKDWDYEKLANDIPIAIRLMDNVNDRTYVPLESQRENLKNKRRIGLGVMGYGSALMMLKVRYGSEEALRVTDKLERFIANTAYKASALLAKEKGAFPLFDKDKFLAGEFIKVLDKETIDLISKYGLRNSHLLSIQPTGNTSILANIVSGGLEPLFMPEYVRTTMMPYPPEGMTIPTKIDWTNKSFDSITEWTWIKEGDENLLRTIFNGDTWKFDQSRGLLRETVVKDFAVRFLEEKGEWDPKADWAATTTELTIEEHVNTMAVFAKYIDSAMSKTVNIPNDYPYSDFKKLYESVYTTGIIKGATTYRAGTMTEVLGSINKENKEKADGITKTSAPSRPKEVSCDIHHVTVKGKKWIVIVGVIGEDPYEVFAFIEKSIHLPGSIKRGKLVKIKRGIYNLECDNGLVIENIAEMFETDEQEALTRMISTALRHGADIQFVFEQLNKAEGDISSFSKAVGRTLKKYLIDGSIANGKTCDNCGGSNVTYQEGCEVCLDCGSGKCS